MLKALDDHESNISIGGRFIVYFHTSFVRTAKALARLRGCAGSPEPSLVAYICDKYHNLMSWLISASEVDLSSTITLQMKVL